MIGFFEVRWRGEGAVWKFPIGIAALVTSLLLLATVPSSAVAARGLRIGGGPIGVVRSVASLALRGLHCRRGGGGRLAKRAAAPSVPGRAGSGSRLYGCRSRPVPHWQVGTANAARADGGSTAMADMDGSVRCSGH